jgi:hypothetical protein
MPKPTTAEASKIIRIFDVSMIRKNSVGEILTRNLSFG